jgi:hypothetical protein
MNHQLSGHLAESHLRSPRRGAFGIRAAVRAGWPMINISAIRGARMAPPPDRLPRPALVPNPTWPMIDGRSPWIPLSLTIWTLLLIGVVLVESRHLPLSLTALLVP